MAGGLIVKVKMKIFRRGYWKIAPVHAWLCEVFFVNKNKITAGPIDYNEHGGTFRNGYTDRERWYIKIEL
jgi:hypothetical protein